MVLICLEDLFDCYLEDGTLSEMQFSVFLTFIDCKTKKLPVALVTAAIARVHRVEEVAVGKNLRISCYTMMGVAERNKVAHHENKINSTREQQSKHESKQATKKSRYPS